jgi:hypothetical protein
MPIREFIANILWSLGLRRCAVCVTENTVGEPPVVDLDDVTPVTTVVAQ